MTVQRGALIASGIRDSLLDCIGETPLVRLARIATGFATGLVAKVEYLNPGGSIKDRPAKSMLDAAERDGLLCPGATIVEPTSGNTGVGLALAGRLRGYHVIAVMPDKMSREKIDLLRAYGAEVVLSPADVAPEAPESYVSVANRLTEEIEGAFQPNQYYNPANPEVHYRTTGPELWEQSGGRITHFVASVGTGGTISGVGRFLKERDPTIEVIGADPVGSVFSGGPLGPYLVEGIGKSTWPGTLDRSVVDRFVAVSDRDSLLTARRLAETEGILAGGSSGTAAHVAIELARELDSPHAMVVVVLPDGGRSYLSKVYNDAWMQQYGLLEQGPDRRVGDLLRDKETMGEMPALITVQSHAKLRDAVALLHEYGVSQLAVVSSRDRYAVVGSLGERGLLRHAVEGQGLLDAEVATLMEPPFPAVSADDPVSEAINLLVGERQAVLVVDHGRPAGLLTRVDLLESLAT